MWAGVSTGQITELGEARIGFDEILPEITVKGNTYRMAVSEKFAGEFEQDPVAYLQKNCNIGAFIDLVQDDTTVEYMVELNSSKGRMQAKYCRKGNLKKMNCKLKNVLLPEDLREEVYRRYKGWTMIENVHVVKGKDGAVKEEFFRIKLENNGQTQDLKIKRNRAEKVEIAGI